MAVFCTRFLLEQFNDSEWHSCPPQPLCGSELLQRYGSGSHPTAPSVKRARLWYCCGPETITVVGTSIYRMILGYLHYFQSCRPPQVRFWMCSGGLHRGVLSVWVVENGTGPNIRRSLWDSAGEAHAGAGGRLVVIPLYGLADW